MPDDTRSLVRELDALRIRFSKIEDGVQLQDALQSALKLFAHLYCRAVGEPMEPDDQAVKMADMVLNRPHSRGKTRWSQQVLAYYAYYRDLSYKLNEPLRSKNSVSNHTDGSSPSQSELPRVPSPVISDPNYIEPVYKHGSATAYLAEPGVFTTYLAEALLIVQKLHEARPYDLASVISASYHALAQREDPLTPELAALRALLKIWTKKLLRDQARKLSLNFDWKTTRLPVPYQGKQKVRLFAELKYVDDENAQHRPALHLQQYTLEAKVIETGHTHPSIVNKDRLGQVNLVDSGSAARVEIDWEVEFNASCLPPSESTVKLDLSVSCSDLQSEPWQYQIELYKQRQTEMGGSARPIPEISSIALSDGELQEDQLLAGLKSTVEQTFDAALVEEVCIDPRCGRFISDQCLGHVNLAKKIIWKAVEQVSASDFWYLSRDQVDGAVRALVEGATSNPTNGDFVDISEEITSLIEHKLTGAGLAAEVHKAAMDLVDLVAGDCAEPLGTPINSIVSRWLLKKPSMDKPQYGNITYLISRLEDAGMLVQQDDRVRVASGFIAHWAKAKRAELA